MLSELLLTATEMSIAELAGRVGLAYPTVYDEVGRLLGSGVLRERRAGRTRMISANPDSPIVPPLRQILLVATGPVVLLSEELGRIEGVHRAFLYGSFAARSRGVEGPPPSDIDVMVIGTPDVAAVYDACSRVERQVGRPVNPTILTEAEFAEESGFLQSVRSRPIVAIIGDEA